MSGSWPPLVFPNLRKEDFNVTSPATMEYNCIAWAASDNQNWWWPDPMGVGYWPPNVPREQTLFAFMLAYGTLGFVRCDDGSLEAGFEKVALYVDAGTPTHAARQLPNGRWTSKLGNFEDVEHSTVACLHGPCYGQVAAYLKRPTAP